MCFAGDRDLIVSPVGTIECAPVSRAPEVLGDRTHVLLFRQKLKPFTLFATDGARSWESEAKHAQRNSRVKPKTNNGS
jgi:hypothetical protein